MTSMSRTVLILAVLGTVPAVPALAGGSDEQTWQVVTTPQLRGDARLGQAVTIQGARLFVAEVLEAISAQTGVAVTADDRSSAGDARLIAWVKGQPAWKTMSALASLFSHKHAPWQWERSGTAPNWKYRFVQTRSAQGLADRLQHEAQQAFEELTESRIAASRRTSAEWTERLADPAPVRIEERAGWGLQVFASVLDPEQQKAVLRRQTRVNVPVDKLPPFGQRLVQDLYHEMKPYRILPSGERETPPMPTEVSFYTWVHNFPTPTLAIEIGYLGGYGYSGGPPLARRFRSYVGDLWVLDGDAASHPEAEGLRVPDGVVSKETSLMDDLERCCMQLAELSGLPLLARTPRSSGTSTDRSPANQVLGEYLAKLAEAYFAMHKWHEGFLLISYASWFNLLEELHRPPYAVVRRLREAAAGNDGLLTPEAILDACKHLSPEQMQVLDASVNEFRWLIRVRHVFNYVGSDSDLRSKLLAEGRVVLTGPVVKSLVAALDMRPDDSNEGPLVDRVVKLVVTLKEATTEAGERQLRAVVWLYDRPDRWITALGAWLSPCAP